MAKSYQRNVSVQYGARRDTRLHCAMETPGGANQRDPALGCPRMAVPGWTRPSTETGDGAVLAGRDER